jgi:hypothetical protein
MNSRKLWVVVIGAMLACVTVPISLHPTRHQTSKVILDRVSERLIANPRTLPELSNRTLRLPATLSSKMGMATLLITDRFLHHVFGLERVSLIAADMQDNKSFLTGFHHDYRNILECTTDMQFLNKKSYNTGEWTADIVYRGNRKTENSFFPAFWKRDEVLNKIQESLYNTSDEPRCDNGTWIVHGPTNEGMEIESIIRGTGELVTAYPITCYSRRKAALS